MVEVIHQPHDKAFKNAMADIRVARDFFEHYLPTDLKLKMDLSRLSIQDGSFVSEELKNNSTDILYKAPFYSGENGYLYVLAEHQSSPDYWLPFRLWIYISRILERYRQQHPNARKLPIVIPVIFYTGNKKYSHSTDLLSLFAGEKDLAIQGILGPYCLIDVNKISDDEIERHRWSGLMELMLKHAKQRDSISLLKQMTRSFISQLLKEANADNYIVGMLNYLFDQGETKDMKLFLSVIQTELPEETNMRSIKEQLIQMGVQQGEQLIILRLLEHKFGKVPVFYINRIKTASEGELFGWSKKILGANTLPEVFAEKEEIAAIKD